MYAWMIHQGGLVTIEWTLDPADDNTSEIDLKAENVRKFVAAFIAPILPSTKRRKHVSGELFSTASGGLHGFRTENRIFCKIIRPGLRSPKLSALTSLNAEIGKSKNLKKVVPINLLSAGSFVAVSYLGNRNSTQDIDYNIDPEIENLGKIKEKLQKAILAIAEKQGLDEEWINSRMEIFAIGETKLQFFRESVEQGVILWRGTNLVIYAVKWEWSLARKLKRIGLERREIDISDAAEILKIMVDKNGGPLTRDTMKAWNTIMYSPIEDAALDRVAATFLAKYGVPGIA